MSGAKKPRLSCIHEITVTHIYNCTRCSKNSMIGLLRRLGGNKI
jgi:hypothetical protein